MKKLNTVKKIKQHQRKLSIVEKTKTNIIESFKKSTSEKLNQHLESRKQHGMKTKYNGK